MNLKVKTYGNVSSGFENIAREIVSNVAEKSGMPEVYTLDLCKNDNDRKYAMDKIKLRTNALGEVLVQTEAQTAALVDGPETVLVEDGLIQSAKSLESLEGIIVHEWGHAKNYWETGFVPSISPLATVILPTFGSGEYWAERNAIEAGYLPACLAGRRRTVDAVKKVKEIDDFYGFLVNMGFMGWRSAFLHNDLSDKEKKMFSPQIKYVDKLWGDLVNSRKMEKNRKLLSNDEARKNPQIFADESALESWVRDRMKEYGLKEGLAYFF